MKLVDAEGEFTIFGGILTTMLVLFSLFTSVVEGCEKWSNGEEKERKRVETELFLWKTICEKTNEFCTQKANCLRSYILSINPAQRIRYNAISKPMEQLDLILKELRNYQVNVLKREDSSISYNDMTISMVYRFKVDNTMSEWREVPCNSENCLSFIENENTTFRHIISNNKKSYIINNKELASDTTYFMNNKDKEYIDKGLKAGSIYCYKISIHGGNDSTIIEAIIGMSLYGRMFVPSDEKELINRCKQNLDIITDSFSSRCKIELEYLYLQYLKETFEKHGETQLSRVAN